MPVSVTFIDISSKAINVKKACKSRLFCDFLWLIARTTTDYGVFHV